MAVFDLKKTVTRFSKVNSPFGREAIVGNAWPEAESDFPYHASMINHSLCLIRWVLCLQHKTRKEKRKEDNNNIYIFIKSTATYSLFVQEGPSSASSSFLVDTTRTSFRGFRCIEEDSPRMVDVF